MSLPFGDGQVLPSEVTERAMLQAWILANLAGPAPELECVMKVPVDIVSRRRAELGAALRGERLLPLDGYTWTRERIDAWIDGVRHGKAAAATIEQPQGPGTLMASWPDGDWAAWEAHPQRRDLWRWVEAEAAAEPPPAELEPPADDRRPVDAPAEEWSRGGPTAGTDRRAGLERPVASPPATGERPSKEELGKVTPKRAERGGPCCYCSTPVLYAELVRELRGWVAHHHCTPMQGMPIPNGSWGESDGDRIRQLRKGSGATQKALIGVFGTEARLSRIENGKQKPTDQELAGFARVVGVHVDIVRGTRLHEVGATVARIEESTPAPAPVTGGAPELFTQEPEEDERDDPLH